MLPLSSTVGCLQSNAAELPSVSGGFYRQMLVEAAEKIKP